MTFIPDTHMKLQVSRSSSILSSSIVIGLLIFGLWWFYTRVWDFSNNNRGLVLALGFLLLSDGLYLLIHAFLRPHHYRGNECEPKDLTVVLATYNSGKAIAKTIEGARRHVPRDHILIVSDTSTDNTAEIASSLGVRVLKNDVNLNKALTISKISPEITTPYTLILDDDTYIGSATIPTSPLDGGYDAVAFNVMPEPEDTIINKFQQYEYRKNMFLSKSLRAGSASVGNVSGAIGLYHTKDIQLQSAHHSGFFGGEDQERTTLTYLYGTGRGVTYTDSTVLTEAPHTWWQLFRQRGTKFGGGWGAAHLNILVLYLRLIVSRRAKFALKFEKGYQVFITLTDPLRLVLFPLLLLDPVGFGIVYAAYAGLEIILWLWTKRADSLAIVMLSPLYGIFNTIGRFVAFPFWVRNRFDFVFRKKFHRRVTRRNLVVEYAIIVVVMLALLGYSIYRFPELDFHGGSDRPVLVSEEKN
jgi:glycosyltransferase involved in cell wall biosynthesis